MAYFKNRSTTPKIKNTTKMENKDLTEKQRQFCHQYMVDFNATQAAIRAGYSESSAQEQSSRMLSIVMVQTYLAELKKDKRDELNYTMNQSLSIDFEIIEKYRYCLEILSNGDSSKKEVEIAERTIKNANTSAYNGAMDRVGKMLGFFDKDNSQQKTESINIINLGQGI